MARVAMIVSNSCNPDPRVEKEAISLASEGYEVTIHAFDRLEDSVENEILDKKKIDGFSLKMVEVYIMVEVGLIWVELLMILDAKTGEHDAMLMNNPSE